MADTTIAAAPARPARSRLAATEVEIPKKPRQVAAPLPARIDVIPLFGSQTLIRAKDARTWVLTTASTKPARLSKKVSMFINAALTAARGQ